MMHYGLYTGGIYFVKRIKAVSTGPSIDPQNTKSGAAMVKCMDVQGLRA